MVGLVGYAPTTPAMSMQYSTIELQSHKYNLSISFLIKSKYICFISITAYIIDKFIQKIVKLKSLKKAPLGNNGIK